MMTRLFGKKLPLLVLLLLAIDAWLIFGYAPVEAVQGPVQKIFYFHVSSAFCMYAGFLIAGLFSFLYLIKREERFDRLSHAGASVGLLFCTMVLMSGPIWARPIWGVWWTWDPRLTTTLMIWLIFVAVLMLRRYFGADPRGRLLASILTLFGMLDIPLIFFAVKLWRGVHPSVLGEEKSMPVEMRVALIFSNVTCLLLMALLIRARKRLLEVEEAHG